MSPPRRITLQQKTRIQKRQQQHLQPITPEHALLQEHNQEGLIVAHYGVYVDIEAQDGRILRCNIRQNLGTVVPGDKVIWQMTSEDTGVLVAVKPRKSLLSRPSAQGKVKAIAANLDQVILTIALQPKPAATAMDSYLVAIEVLGLPAIIVCNKQDMLAVEDKPLLDEQLAIYQQIGYDVVLVSSKTGYGMGELKRLLAGKTSIFVGQSGVGKSSLIATLLPEGMLTSTIPTEVRGHGTHTTTTARLYHLPLGGDLIDSPGIRDFVLWDMPAATVAQGFIEFKPYLAQCQFRNCKHVEERNCGVRNALQHGLITAARWASYCRIVMGARYKT